MVLRVHFPDRYVLQGFFRPSETGKCISAPVLQAAPSLQSRVAWGYGNAQDGSGWVCIMGEGGLHCPEEVAWLHLQSPELHALSHGTSAACSCCSREWGKQGSEVLASSRFSMRKGFFSRLLGGMVPGTLELQYSCSEESQ